MIDGEARILEVPTKGKALAAALGAGAAAIEGWIEVPEAGRYQLQWIGERVSSWQWNERDPVSPDREVGSGIRPLDLAPGWHRLRVEIAPGKGRVELRFGRRGTDWLRPERFRHPTD